MEVGYLNTDLEIESSNDLTIIVNEFVEDVLVLFNGKAQSYNMASFESSDLFLGADEALVHFCTLVENLSEEGRRTWNNCVSRVFDLGFKSGDSAVCYRTELRPSTVRRVAEIGASIVVSIYPTGLPEFDPSHS